MKASLAWPEKPWLFVSEAAALIGVSRMTIYRWIDRGDLEACGCHYFTKVSTASLKAKLQIVSQLSQP